MARTRGCPWCAYTSPCLCYGLGMDMLLARGWAPCTVFFSPRHPSRFPLAVLLPPHIDRLIKLGLSIDEDDAAADEGEDDIPDLDDAEGDEESTMEQVD